MGWGRYQPMRGTEIGKHSPHQLGSNREPSSKGFYTVDALITAWLLQGEGERSSLRAYTYESHTTYLLSFQIPAPKSKFGVGLTKGACPNWAWGVGRYGRLGNRKGHLFLTLFFQSFLLFHFLVLVPQFYPRCNVSRRERQRESEAGQTDEMETHPPKMIQSRVQDYKSRDKKRSSLRGRGVKKKSRDLTPSPQVKN